MIYLELQSVHPTIVATTSSYFHNTKVQHRIIYIAVQMRQYRGRLRHFV